MKKRFGLFFMALLTMAVLGGCGADSTGESSEVKSSKESVQSSESSAESTASKETQNTPVQGGSVVVGIQQDIDSLDPHKANLAGTKEILFNIFEGLVKPDENGDMVCAVAKDYKISEDGLVYTFTLRDGVKFHDGTTVTCEDVKYSLERASGLLDGTALISTLSAAKGGITKVDILDNQTVQVTIGAANPELLYSFTAAIIPKDSGEKENASPIGTGPFSFVSYTPQEGIVIAKNAQYWQEGFPILDQVKFKIVASAETAMMELQGGTIDIYPYLADSQIAELKSGYQIMANPSTVIQALFLNNAVAPLDDVRVRQAINYAIDQEAVNAFVFGGNSAIVSSAMLPTLESFYVDENQVYGTTANVAKAKELLAQAGYPDGFDLEITISSAYEVHTQAAEVVAEQLKAAGINAKLNVVENQIWYDQAYVGRNYQATLYGLSGDLTPGYIINRFQSTSKKNFVNFNSPEFDQVYGELLKVTTLEGRIEGYKKLQKIVTENAASAFIQVPPNNTAVSDKLAGYKSYPVYVQDMSTVYFK